MAIKIKPHKTCICERCGNEWIPKNEKIPVQCPKCNSPYWNKPRRKKAAQNGSKSKEEGSEK